MKRTTNRFDGRAAIVSIQSAMRRRTLQQFRDARIMLSALRAVIRGRDLRPDHRRVARQQITVGQSAGYLTTEDANAMRERVNGWRGSI